MILTALLMTFASGISILVVDDLPSDWITIGVTPKSFCDQREAIRLPSPGWAKAAMIAIRDQEIYPPRSTEDGTILIWPKRCGYEWSLAVAFS